MSLNINAARCEALFASNIQQSDRPSVTQLRQAIQQTIRAWGSRGCAARVAQEYGDHPEIAMPRMRWALEQVNKIFTKRGWE